MINPNSISKEDLDIIDKIIVDQGNHIPMPFSMALDILRNCNGKRDITYLLTYLLHLFFL